MKQLDEIYNELLTDDENEEEPDLINSTFDWFGILESAFIKLNQLEDKWITPFNKEKLFNYIYDEDAMARLDDLQEYDKNNSRLNGMPQTIKGHIDYRDPKNGHIYGKINVKIDISYDFDEEIEKLEG